ncbi:hypothetical protein M231_05063 [Tremella mesenterica]|uniref:J domain-containing protein n=1 Tax=Tremella mesenterica TaxID=5217 RepID=A0A4Q1BIY8_TREME|nr:hypothetical protein M231_05063 [Tremella mesenterica]
MRSRTHRSSVPLKKRSIPFPHHPPSHDRVLNAFWKDIKDGSVAPSGDESQQGSNPFSGQEDTFAPNIIYHNEDDQTLSNSPASRHTSTSSIPFSGQEDTSNQKSQHASYHMPVIHTGSIPSTPVIHTVTVPSTPVNHTVIVPSILVSADTEELNQLERLKLARTLLLDDLAYRSHWFSFSDRFRLPHSWRQTSQHDQEIREDMWRLTRFITELEKDSRWPKKGKEHPVVELWSNIAHLYRTLQLPEGKDRNSIHECAMEILLEAGIRASGRNKSTEMNHDSIMRCTKTAQTLTEHTKRAKLERDLIASFFGLIIVGLAATVGLLSHNSCSDLPAGLVSQSQLPWIMLRSLIISNQAGPSKVPYTPLRFISSIPVTTHLAPRAPSRSYRSRPFSSSRVIKKTHYEALRLPRNATKQQIKSQFYALSKKHHPDAPGGDASKFHEINDAYATLGDEGKRKSYDTSFQPHSSPSNHLHPSHFSQAPLSRSSSGPHRAWQRSNPSARSNFTPNDHLNSHPHTYPRQHYNPSTVFGRRKDTEAARTTHDPPQGGESMLWRIGLVVGLLMAVISFGGGLTASAEEFGSELDRFKEDEWVKRERDDGTGQDS